MLGSAAGSDFKIMSLRRLWWAAILLLGVSAGAVGWTIYQLRNDAIDAAVTESGNIATILAGQLSRSLQATDAVLAEIKRSTKDLDIETDAKFRTAFRRREFHDLLMDFRNRLPQAFNIAIAGRDGNLVVSSAGWPTPAVNVSDRDYFKEARNSPFDQLVTSIPIRTESMEPEPLFSRVGWRPPAGISSA